MSVNTYSSYSFPASSDASFLGSPASSTSWPSRFFLVTLMLASGAIASLTRRASFHVEAPGINSNDDSHTFQKPFFSLFLKSFGQLFCLLLFFFLQYRRRMEEYRTPFEISALIHSPADDALIPDLHYGFTRKRDWLRFAPIAVCGLLATGCSAVAQSMIPMSIWQMLVGTSPIFVIVLSRIMLYRHHAPFRVQKQQIASVACVVVGIVTVGTAHLMAQGDDASWQSNLIAVALLLFANVMYALEFVCEQVLVQQRNVPPLKTVGGEGTFGLLLMVLVVLPACYFIPGSDAGSRYENSLDSVVMISNSYVLIALCLAYVFAITINHACAVSITKRLSALHRCLLDTTSLLLVWIVQLILYYSISEEVGEAWTNWSFMQLGGFLLVILGTYLFHRFTAQLWSMGYSAAASYGGGYGEVK